MERSDWTFEIWVDELTEEEADALSDALCDIACGGQGEGDDHQCRRSFVGTMRRGGVVEDEPTPA